VVAKPHTIASEFPAEIETEKRGKRDVTTKTAYTNFSGSSHNCCFYIIFFPIHNKPE
jgi:hypothetical protein